MDAGMHIIGKQEISVKYRGHTDALDLQKRVNEICNDKLPARLSQIMDRFAGADRTIRLGSISIDASITNSADFDEELINIIGDELERSLMKAISEDPAVITELGGKQNFTELLIFYVQNGYLPWWSVIQNSVKWREVLATFFERPSKEVLALIIPLLKSETVSYRLASLLSIEQVIAIVSTTQDLEASFIKVVQEEIDLTARSFKEIDAGISLNEFIIAWKTALLLSVTENSNDILLSSTRRLVAIFISKNQEQFIYKIASLISNNPLKKVLLNAIEAKEFKQQSKEETINEPVIENSKGILTNTAGLVIIAPYLSTFFKHLDLIKDNKLIDAQRAVTLVHFIATGSEEFEEFEVVLEKILCGVKLNEPILSGYKIKDEEKHQIEELLTSVISHWSILKNTSIDGLKASFLQREGRLSQLNNQWRLIVQQQAHDMLLDHIPWNFKMIKLPWMDGLFTVEWN